jgi:hypothetical protein
MYPKLLFCHTPNSSSYESLTETRGWWVYTEQYDRRLHLMQNYRSRTYELRGATKKLFNFEAAHQRTIL